MAGREQGMADKAQRAMAERGSAGQTWPGEARPSVA